MLDSTEQAQKVVLISGSSGGIGLAAAEAFHAKGWKVWAGCRNPSQDHKHLRFIYLDVTDEQSIRNCVEQIIIEEGRIDALINNAGYAVIGAEESTSIEEVEKLFDVNFYGALRLIQAVCPHMRAQHSGHIINISSGCGARAVPGLGIYSASKFALEALSESLAVTLSPWNIHVSIVEPGRVNTPGLKNSIKIAPPDEDPIYTKFTDNLFAKLSDPAFGGQNSEEVGSLIVEIAETEKPHLRYQTSAKIKEILGRKFVDLSGNAMKEEQLEFFHSILEN